MICTAPYRSLDWGVFTRKARVITVKNNDIGSHMRVLGQHKRLIITSPAPGGTVGRGRILIQANAYDTTDDVTGADYELTAPDGRKITGTLRRHGDWSWIGEWNNPNALSGKCTIRIAAHGRSGATWDCTAWFTCSQTPSPNARPTNDWPSVFGVERQSRARDDAIAPPLRLAWIGNTEALIYYFSSPVVADGKVIIGVADGELGHERAGVVCFDACTGKRLWKAKIGADVHSSVAAINGKVYAVSNMGQVSCLEIETGTLAWARETHTPRFGWTLSLGPVGISPGRVFVAPDYTPLVCLDPETGKQHWQRDQPSGRYQTSSMFTLDDVGYTSQRNWYGAVDVNTGEFLWKKDVERARGMCTPTRYGNVVYVPHLNVLRAVHAGTGDEIWQAPLDGPMTQSPGLAVAHDGRVFITHGDGIYGSDAKTGERIWKLNTNDPELFAGSTWQSLAESSSPAVVGQYVYVGSDNGTFYGLEAATGKIAWEYFIGVPIKSSPAISGNMVFVSGFDGNVYAFAGTMPL